MGPLPGRRTRRRSLIDPDESPQSIQEEGNLHQLHGIFKQHFEATFAPLPEDHHDLQSDDEAVESAEGAQSQTSWDGLSDADSEHPEIIEHELPRAERPVVSNRAQKSYMSSKPPQSQDFDAIASSTSNVDNDGDPETDRANLKKDLALQRLLQESHLLERDGLGSGDGETRHRALDMRFQKLGSKSSIYAQAKMPLSQRTGIAQKAAERSEHRRREARENGIILEKVGGAKREKAKPRDRSIHASGVGKFRKGMLTLSKQDVREIEGPKRKSRR